MNRDYLMDEEAIAILAAEVEHDREDAEVEVMAGLFVAALIGFGIALS